MRFAITAIDRYLGVFEAFVHAGWQPLKLFTFPAGHEQGNQQAAIAFAEKNKAAIQLSRMTEQDLRALKDEGCDALIVASYRWITPDWQPYLKYAVNFHPSPLPEGRGPYPITHAVLDKWDHWAVTCHKLTAEVDKGDILAAEKFPLQPDECHERLDLKIQMAARRLALRVAGKFTELWNAAEPQTGGSYWPQHTLKERVIDFRQPVEGVLRLIRAFGAAESIAHVGNTWLIVTRAVGWAEAHNHAPGTVMHVFNKTIVVAAQGGYVGLLESNFAPPEIAAELQGDTNPNVTIVQTTLINKAPPKSNAAS